MITVHLILNAHIDPIWLWPWPSGLDSVLATCRSACERLEAHPDVHFCRGEAWAYGQVERAAPELFARIRRHIDAGRWHIVGGWWIQPDCNGPSGFALARQIEIGRQYFRRRFGLFPRCAYNVDTFGHAASLPALLRAAGQDRYVMMRPQEHELELPARVFRWRGHADGAEVVVFRIAGMYACRELTEGHIRAALADLPPGLEHTMCFVGLGDHGGGPTERQIAWLTAHADRIPGCRLEYSWPDRFFDAIWPQRAALPVFTGELQSHAMGCFSVHRPVKVAVRQAEHGLVQAERMLTLDPRPDPGSAAALESAWRRVCFAHFHDIYGGTCIPSAYPQVHAQLGQALASADEVVHLGLRRMLEKLPDDPHYRIVLLNASDQPFDGYATHEPWFVQEPFEPHWRLIDEQDRPVPFQPLEHEALVNFDRTYFLRLLLPIRAEPGQLRVLRVDPRGGPPAPADLTAGPERIANAHGVGVRLGARSALALPAGALPLPQLELVPDPTDTWGHGTDRYGPGMAVAEWEPGVLTHSGPLMACLQQRGRIGASRLLVEYRVYAGAPWVEYWLRVLWLEERRLLKLAVPLPAELVRHEDGITGDALVRPPDGAERPVRDWTRLELADGRQVGIVLPDAYALDASPERVRLTLLRSPLMAQHDPLAAAGPRAMHADQGWHEFRLRFCGGRALDRAELERHALEMHRPLLSADLTRGMRPV